MGVAAGVTSIVIGMVAVLCLQVATGATVQTTPARTLSTPGAAIAAHAAATGVPYAGACEETRSPEDIGRVCFRLVEERDDMNAFLLGRTFSEFDRWLFVERRASEWVVVTEAPLDFHDTSGRIPWPR